MISMQPFEIDEKYSRLRVFVEWAVGENNRNEIVESDICDLDLEILCYDDRARLVEKLDADHNTSADGACRLVSDIGSSAAVKTYVEFCKIDLSSINTSVHSLLFFLDGSKRNFAIAKRITLCCSHSPQDTTAPHCSTDRPLAVKHNHILAPSTLPRDSLWRQTYFLADFSSSLRSSSTSSCEGLVLGVMHREDCTHASNTDESGHKKSRWILRSLFHPMSSATYCINGTGSSSPLTRKEDLAHSSLTRSVPALLPYTPRLFPSVRHICAALSSQALPSLKVAFGTGRGLPLGEFTRVIFRQLSQSHPMLLQLPSLNDAAATVAVIQEMFALIDYNGDRYNSWDEFTTFCIQMCLTRPGAPAQSAMTSASPLLAPLDSEVERVMYNEEIHSQTPHTQALQVPRDGLLAVHTLDSPTHRAHLAIVCAGTDHAVLVDERFRPIARLGQDTIRDINTTSIAHMHGQIQSLAPSSRPHVLDVAHLLSRDMFAITCSDRTITIAREYITLGGQNIKYSLYNKICTDQQHKKLCWSDACKVLCSVAADDTIYGWDIDCISQDSSHKQQQSIQRQVSTKPLFAVSRHSDTITGVVSLDFLGLFATCSLDRRIVMWDATTGRAKGVLGGHMQGVRGLSASAQGQSLLMLSVGFDTEGRVWDTRRQSLAAVLAGHRCALVCGQLMCQRSIHYGDEQVNGRNTRAVTVDERGELRLWCLSVIPSTPDPPSRAPRLNALQVFTSTAVAPSHFTGTDFRVSSAATASIRFLALPFTEGLAKGSYSDIVACASHLLRFVPECVRRVWEAPVSGCVCYSNDSAVLSVVTGSQTIVQIDVCTGARLDSILVGMCRSVTGSVGFSAASEISQVEELCVLGVEGRRYFAGTTRGRLLLLNCLTGATIDSLTLGPIAGSTSARADGRNRDVYDEGDEITGVVVRREGGVSSTSIGTGSGSVFVHTSSLGGRLCRIAECAGAMSVHTCVEDVLGSGPCHPVLGLSLVPWGSELLVRGSERWALVDPVKLQRKAMFEEMHAVGATEGVILSGGDSTSAVIVAISTAMRLYRVDRGSGGGSLSCTLLCQWLQSESSVPQQVTCMRVLSSSLIITGCDDGFMHLWTIVTTATSAVPNRSELHRMRSWRAHFDTVIRALPLPRRRGRGGGVVCTVSVDGYVRVWNTPEDGHLEKTTAVGADDDMYVCLGEAALPNLPDSMQSMRTQGHTHPWTYSPDRPPATPAQQLLAELLIKDLTRHRQHEVEVSTLKTGESTARFEGSQDRINETPSDIPEATTLTLPQKPLVTSLIDTSSRLRTKRRLSLLDSLRDGGWHQEALTEVTASVYRSKSLDAVKTVCDDDEYLNSDSNVTRQRLHNQSLSKVDKVKLKRDTDIIKLKSHWVTPQQLCGPGRLPRAFSSSSLGSAPTLLSVSATRTACLAPREQERLRVMAQDPARRRMYEAALSQATSSILINTQPFSLNCSRAQHTYSALTLVPSLRDLDAAELTFGSQADLFTHAQQYMREKESVSSSGRGGTGRMQQRGVALARIEQRLRHVGPLVRLVIPPSHDNVDISAVRSGSIDPASSDADTSEATEKSAVGLQTTRRISKDIGNGFDWSKREDVEKLLCQAIMTRYMQKQRLLHASTVSCQSQQTHKEASEKTSSAALTTLRTISRSSTLTRSLLPYYSAADIDNFVRLWRQVDSVDEGSEGGGSALDLQQWMKLYAKLNIDAPGPVQGHTHTQEAHRLFRRADRNGDGLLQLDELVPLVFGRATRAQLQIILTECAAHLETGGDYSGRDGYHATEDRRNTQKRHFSKLISHSKVDELFAAYDVGNVGYVRVGLLRERVKARIAVEDDVEGETSEGRIQGMPLSEEAALDFLQQVVPGIGTGLGRGSPDLSNDCQRTVVGWDDDDLLNRTEFAQMLRHYTCRKR